MTTRRTVAVALVWVLSLVGVRLWAQAPAIQQQSGELEVTVQAGQAFGPIISGEDLGFQLVHDPMARGGEVSGRLMVRIEGEWHVATGAMTIQRGGAR